LALRLTRQEVLARARSDLRLGVPVAIAAGRGGALVIAAELATTERLAALRELGPVDLAITGWRAETLKARAYDGDLARLALPAEAGVAWVRAVADPASDLAMPLKGPFVSRRDGPAVAHRAGLALAKQAHLLPAVLSVPVSGIAALARQLGLTLLGADDCAAATVPHLSEVAGARVPLEVAIAGRVRVFRPDDAGEEHYSIEIGAPARTGPVLARLHSACFTGDVLGSLKCDCGPQLHAALAAIAAEGAGVLLYLNQEGRGIGLANKMRAYSLQDQGFDTVEANHRLGFEDDERDFRIGAEMLKAMGFTSVRLMTNNPEKVARMQSCGVTVAERVPLKAGLGPENADYLATKRAKSGHLL
jgi:GTP cyclohydrolase II